MFLGGLDTRDHSRLPLEDPGLAGQVEVLVLRVFLMPPLDSLDQVALADFIEVSDGLVVELDMHLLNQPLDLLV